jgi:hypothetical protein
MKGPIDGGWSEADEVPQEQPERTDITDAESARLSDPLAAYDEWSRQVARDIEDSKDLSLTLEPEIGNEGFDELERGDKYNSLDELWAEDAEAPDSSSDLQVEVHPKDQSALSKSGRKSITDSAQGLLKFAEQRLISLGADVVLPGLGGRLADLTFEVLDVVNSVQALSSDDPVLDVPLPSPVPSIGFTLEIPLASGEDSEAAPPLALCVAPDSPSLTGGWALDAGEHDDQQTQEPPAGVCETPPERRHLQQDPFPLPMAVLRTSGAERPKPRARPQSANTCIVEVDLGSLPLPKDRKPRAQILAILAYEYAPQLRKNSELLWFDLFVIADKGRRCGVWIWLNAEPYPSSPGNS